MQVGFVLKEVQVPPGLVLAVVGRTARNAAFRAGEPAAPGEIQVDVQPLGRGVEFALRHHPRRLDAQRHLKQFGVTHALPPPQRLRCDAIMARGRRPEPPGYLTHDDVPGVACSRGTAGDGDDRAR
jgi:hypothetical protein